MMLGKEQLSGLWCALSAVAIAVLFTLESCLFVIEDPGWGDSWFPHGALLLLSPTNMAHWCVL